MLLEHIRLDFSHPFLFERGSLGGMGMGTRLMLQLTSEWPCYTSKAQPDSLFMPNSSLVRWLVVRNLSY